jgi:hypothetical protein
MFLSGGHISGGKARLKTANRLRVRRERGRWWQPMLELLEDRMLA